MSVFSEKVRAIVQKIPRGQVRTYAEVARLAGSPRAAQAVGNLLHSNRDSTIPCHRVVRSDWQTGGYNRGTAEKIKILQKEGLKISKGKIAGVAEGA